MIVTSQEVIDYIRYYASKGNSHVYVRPDDLARLSNDQFLSLRKEIGTCEIVQDEHNEKVADGIDRLCLRKNKQPEFIGSLPTEKLGKWTKTC